MRVDGFQEQVVHELKPPCKFPGDVHHQESEQLDILVVELEEGLPGKDDELTVFDRHGRNGVDNTATWPKQSPTPSTFFSTWCS